MTGSTPSPDLFLARRAAAGHPDAWDQIIEEHGKRLFNLAYQFAGTREEAEDLTQEIFIRLYRNLRSYKYQLMQDYTVPIDIPCSNINYFCFLTTAEKR